MGNLTSMLWPTNGVGDSPASGYTPEQVQRMMRLINNFDYAAAGVFYGELNNLAVSSPGANSISIATGALLIYGILCFHDDSATAIALSSVAADTAGIVYAEVDWTTQEFALAVSQQTSGNTTIPTLTQTAGTKWQIPLATYLLNSGGTVTLTDVREFVNARWVKEFVQAFDWEVMSDGVTTSNRVLWKPTENVVLGESILATPVYLFNEEFNSGNAYVTAAALVAEDYLTDGDVEGSADSYSEAIALVATGGDFLFTGTPLDIGTYIQGIPLTEHSFLVRMTISRNGAHANDTLNGDIYFYGFSVEYLARK